MADNTLIFAVHDALLELFGHAVADGVRVADTWETGPEGIDQVVVGKVEATAEFAALGKPTVPQYEEMEVTCGAGAVRADKAEARQALVAILDACIGAVREQPKLGVDGVQWSRVSKIETGITRTDNHPAAEAKFVVEVKTRIYP